LNRSPSCHAISSWYRRAVILSELAQTIPPNSRAFVREQEFSQQKLRTFHEVTVVEISYVSHLSNLRSAMFAPNNC